jgi:hypothetical protein
MGFGLFALVVGLAVYFYGGYMTNRSRELERGHHTRSR